MASVVDEPEALLAPTPVASPTPPPSSRAVGGWVTVASTVAVWAVGAVIFFRYQLTSGFDRIMGNRGDARLIAFLNEHWWLVVRGRQGWLDPSFFYPQTGTLGYADTFFLQQVAYAPFRAIGLDPLLSYQLSIVVLSLVGFASFVALCRRALKAPLAVALLGAWLFTFANNLFVKAGHAQMYGLYLMPGLLLLGFTAWQLRERRRALSAVLGVLTGLYAGLCLFSWLYATWLTALAVMVTFGVAFVLQPRRGGRAVVDAVRSGWLTLGAFGLGAAAGLVPFAVTYLPVADQTGGRHYGEAMAFAGQVTDVLNVGRLNVLWSNLFDGDIGPDAARLRNYEVALAVTPLLLLTTLTIAAVLTVRWWRRPDRGRTAAPVALVLAITALVLLVLPVRTEPGSLWAAVWILLPGSHAIRAIFRVELVNGLVVTLALVAGVTALLTQRRGRPLRRGIVVAGVALALLLVIEQLNTENQSIIDRSNEQAVLASVPPAPGGCRSFYVAADTPRPEAAWSYQLDAMLIAHQVGLPTLNGYSGWFPPDWQLLDVEGPNYEAAVAAWVDRNGLGNAVCRLELTTMTWQVRNN